VNEQEQQNARLKWGILMPSGAQVFMRACWVKVVIYLRVSASNRYISCGGSMSHLKRHYRRGQFGTPNSIQLIRLLDYLSFVVLP